MEKNILALMNGLADDMGTMSKRLGDPKDYLSDNKCPFTKHLKTPIFRSFEGTMQFFPVENISDGTLMLNYLFCKSLFFIENRPFKGMLQWFCQELKNMMKKPTSERKIKTYQQPFQ